MPRTVAVRCIVGEGLRHAIRVFFFVIALCAIFTRGDVILDTENWAGDTDRLYWQIAGSRSSYSMITWEYSFRILQYSDSTPHPYVFLRQYRKGGDYIRGRCFGDTDLFRLYDLHDPRLVALTNSDDACVSLNGALYCQGHIKVAAAYPTTWYVTVAYRCIDRVPPREAQQVQYNITLIGYDSVTCAPTSRLASDLEVPESVRLMFERLSSVYDYYSTWNYLGASKTDIEKLSTHFPILFTINCYQYMVELVLRLFLPQCVGGKVTYQCTEMCDDFRDGCGDDGLGAILLVYTRGCNFLADLASDNPCVYKPVNCSQEPAKLQHGYSIVTNTSLNSTVRYECNEDFELIGNDTAMCNYSGQWQLDTFPRCQKIPPSFHEDNDELLPVIVAVSVVGGLVNLFLVLALVIYTRYKHDAVFLVLRYCPCLLCSRYRTPTDDKEYDAIVLYSDEDEAFTRRHIHERLEASGYRVFADYRDGLPGEAPIRYIPAVLAKSCRAVIVLSQAFLDDNTCEFFMTLAVHQTLQSDAFHVIVVLLEERKQLKNVPHFLTGYLRSCQEISVKSRDYFHDVKHRMPPRSVTEQTQIMEQTIATEQTQIMEQIQMTDQAVIRDQDQVNEIIYQVEQEDQVDTKGINLVF